MTDANKVHDVSIGKENRYLLYLFLLFLILQAGFLITEYRITNYQFGVPLDDTWIHFRFAENFAHGNFFEYNVGEPTPGTTSPLWVTLLAVPFLFSAKAYMSCSIAASSLFFLLTVILTYRLSLKLGLSSSFAFLAAVVTLFCGRLLWSSLSAMEITLFCFLSLMIFMTHTKEIEEKRVSIIGGILLGLAANARPETYLLAVLYYIVTIVLLKDSLKNNLGRLAVSFLVFILLLMPYPIFSYIHTGSFLPNTYQGQVPGVKYYPDLTYIYASLRLFEKDNAALTLIWFASMVYFIRCLFKKKYEPKYLLMNLWIILLPAISTIVAPNWRHHGRYLIPLTPFIYIVCVDILQKFFSYLREKEFKYIDISRKVLVSLILLFALAGSAYFAYILGWNVENINDQQVKIGTWAKEKLPGEKAFGMNDIGAITFITKEYVVDMAGLVTPEVFGMQKMSEEEGAKALFKLLKSKNVNYIIVYPGWYSYIMNNYSKYLVQVYSARLEKNTICGGDEMFVYRITWDKISM